MVSIAKKIIKDSTICLIDLKKINYQYKMWKNKLPFIKPFYAIKCNPDKKILNYMVTNLGLKSFDCASQKEIENVLDITKDASHIIYANPCKRISSLQYCNSIYKNMMMTFDSIEELKKIHKYCPNAQLVIRIKGDDSGSICKFNSKFGIEHTECNNFFKIAKSLDLNIMGVSFHVGSGCNNPRAYHTTLQYCKYVIDESKKKYNYNINLIDIGGGFIASKPELYNNICNVITNSIKELNLQDKQFIGEPGRFMVETSHSLILSIINKKVINKNGKITIIYYVSDGLYGSLNNIIYDKSIIKLEYPKKYKMKPKYKSIVFGPTCDSFDKLGEFDLPDMDINTDRIIINNAGAYTVSAGSEFNGMSLPIKIYKNLHFR